MAATTVMALLFIGCGSGEASSAVSPSIKTASAEVETKEIALEKPVSADASELKAGAIYVGDEN